MSRIVCDGCETRDSDCLLSHLHILLLLLLPLLPRFGIHVEITQVSKSSQTILNIWERRKTITNFHLPRLLIFYEMKWMFSIPVSRDELPKNPTEVLPFLPFFDHASTTSSTPIYELRSSACRKRVGNFCFCRYCFQKDSHRSDLPSTFLRRHPPAPPAYTLGIISAILRPCPPDAPVLPSQPADVSARTIETVVVILLNLAEAPLLTACLFDEQRKMPLCGDGVASPPIYNWTEELLCASLRESSDLLPHTEFVEAYFSNQWVRERRGLMVVYVDPRARKSFTGPCGNQYQHENYSALHVSPIYHPLTRGHPIYLGERPEWGSWLSRLIV